MNTRRRNRAEKVEIAEENKTQSEQEEQLTDLFDTSDDEEYELNPDELEQDSDDDTISENSVEYLSQENLERVTILSQKSFFGRKTIK